MNKIYHQISYLELNTNFEEEPIGEEPIGEESIEEPLDLCDDEQIEDHQLLSSCCQQSIIQQGDSYFCSECSETLDLALDVIAQSDEERFLNDDYEEFTGRIMADLEDFN